jgi:hypothetical protein
MTQGSLPATLQDFNSIVITIDHLTVRDDDRHVVQKFVTSTQTLKESIVALMHYYGEQHLLQKMSTINLFSEIEKAENPVFIYPSPENIQLVTDMETWEYLVSHPQFGDYNQLVTTLSLFNLVAGVLPKEPTKEAGDKRTDVQLQLIDVSFSDVLTVDETQGVADEPLIEPSLPIVE